MKSETVTPESILASLNRSTDTLQSTRRSETIAAANRNIINCRNWLKDRHIAYYYDHKSKTYKLGAPEVVDGNNKT